MNVRSTAIVWVLLNQGLTSKKDVKVKVIEPECKQLLFQQKIHDSFFDTTALTRGFEKKLETSGNAPLCLHSRLMSMGAAVKEFCDGKKEEKWATTYIDLPDRVDTYIKYKQIMKMPGGVYVLLVEMNYVDGDAWNNTDEVDDILSLDGEDSKPRAKKSPPS